MAELKIVYLPFSSLIPDPRNSNYHPPEQISQIAASIKKYGFNGAILIDQDRKILAGEGRYQAVKLLASSEGYRKKIPTITISHLTEVQRRAFLIADNQIARNSTWDLDKLAKELTDLNFAKYDLNLELGFSDEYLAEILKQADEITSAPAENIVAVEGHTRKVKTASRGEDLPEGKGKVRQLAVLVYCTDPDHQEEVYQQLTDQGLTCKNTVI